MATPPDDRSPFAKALVWVSIVTTAAIEMVLPGVLGSWIDRRLGTVALFMIAGFAIGMPLGLWHLLRMTRVATHNKRDCMRSHDGTRKK